jgi:RHS repeat-associated protein
MNDAWGNSVASTGTTVNPFKWVGNCGYYTDNSTGQVYVRARMYQPTLAQWKSEDALKFVDGPNPYSVTRNSPSQAADPSGLICRIELKGKRGQLQYLEPYVMPEEDEYNPVPTWVPIATSYVVDPPRKQWSQQSCDCCIADVELVARAQRYYRLGWNSKNERVPVGHDNKPIGEENDPRNFASLLRAKACYTNVVCNGVPQLDYDEEAEFLFYNGRLGVFILERPGSLRHCASKFSPTEPVCSVADAFIAHERQCCTPGIVDPTI